MLDYCSIDRGHGCDRNSFAARWESIHRCSVDVRQVLDRGSIKLRSMRIEIRIECVGYSPTRKSFVCVGCSPTKKYFVCYIPTKKYFIPNIFGSEIDVKSKWAGEAHG